LPRFKQEGKQVLLSPLYAKLDTLHIILLRQGVALAEVMGWDENTTGFYAKLLTSSIESHGQYMDQVYNTYMEVRQNTNNLLYASV
jgi:hypothetical protein